MVEQDPAAVFSLGEELVEIVNRHHVFYWELLHGRAACWLGFRQNRRCGQGFDTTATQLGNPREDANQDLGLLFPDQRSRYPGAEPEKQ